MKRICERWLLNVLRYYNLFLKRYQISKQIETNLKMTLIKFQLMETLSKSEIWIHTTHGVGGEKKIMKMIQILILWHRHFFWQNFCFTTTEPITNINNNINNNLFEWQISNNICFHVGNNKIGTDDGMTWLQNTFCFFQKLASVVNFSKGAARTMTAQCQSRAKIKNFKLWNFNVQSWFTAFLLSHVLKFCLPCNYVRLIWN